jgi:prolipoprotein diacylglyceryltransferase
MHQLLFVIPGVNVPIYGFGAMLFCAFLLCTIWAQSRAAKIGLSKDNVQDLAFLLFITGILGARIFYMIQFRHQFEFNGILGTLGDLVGIDRGGIVFYGCLIGGFFGFMAFRQTVLKRLKITVWQLADVIAPLLALGLAIGRIGCYLNGCCWGQVAVPECQPVPLAGPACRFPLIPAQAKDQLLKPGGEKEPRPHCRAVQTGTGFTVEPRLEGDPRSVVTAVEPGSDAATAGLKTGDRITTVNGKPNDIVLVLDGDRAAIDNALKAIAGRGTVEVHKPIADTGLFGCHKAKAESGDWLATIAFAEPLEAATAKRLCEPFKSGLSIRLVDRYVALLEDWPRGGKGLSLGLNDTGEASFTPRTVTLFPTQLYEAISMVLLIGVLVAWQPFKRHDGQLFVMWLVGYGTHRFLNESIRIEPTYAIGGIDIGLTASQWISLAIVAGGLVLEVVLRKTNRR